MLKCTITGITSVPIDAITQQYMAVSANPITIGPENTLPLPSCHGSAPMNSGLYGSRTRMGFLANLLDNFIVMINGGQVLDDGPFRLLGRKHRQ